MVDMNFTDDEKRLIDEMENRNYLNGTFGTFGTDNSESENNFPVDAFPEKITDFIKEESRFTQTPEEMVGSVLLGMMPTAFQKGLIIEAKTGYTEPLGLFVIPIASPGERKSAIMKRITQPFRDYEAMVNAANAEEIHRNRSDRKILEGKLRKEEEKLEKGIKEGSQEKVYQLVKELADFKDKYPLQLLVDDTTPEKLINILSQQGGAVTQCSAEGGLFEAMLGRYDGKMNIDVYLKGHAGDSIRVDRVHRPPDYIPDPRLSLLNMVQPTVLHSIIGNEKFKGLGLLGRHVFVVCSSKIGYRDVDPDPMNPIVGKDYDDFITKILLSNYSGVIRLSKEAKEVYIAYARKIEKELRDKMEHMRDWGGKAPGLTLRIAGILHVLHFPENPCGIHVNNHVMADAVRLTEYYKMHAIYAYQEMGTDEDIEKAKSILKRIEEKNEYELTKRDIWRLCKNQAKFPKADDLDSGLKVLEDYGYIRIEEIKGKGRPTTKIKVNPLILSTKSAKSKETA